METAGLPTGRWANLTSPLLMIAACLIFKDSASYLHEWLCWHVHYGIERFWLYDNDSSDDWQSVVGPWQRKAHITTIHQPGQAQMLEAYADCLQRARHEPGVDWLAFLDDDEFLQPAPGTTIERALTRYIHHAGLAVPWMVYGSSGAEERTDGWVIERFTRRAPAPDQHVKCIVQPALIAAPLVSGHHFQPVFGRNIVDENYAIMTSPWAPNPSARLLRINHYLVKSWAEWKARRIDRPTVDGRPLEHPAAKWREWDIGWSSCLDQWPLSHINFLRQLSLETLASHV